MSIVQPQGTGTVGAPAPREGDDERLRRAAKQLEGVFFEQLLQAMRATVPHDGTIDGGQGEEVFTSLLDQHVAEQAPARWERGIGDALYAQLRRALPHAAEAHSGSATPTERTAPTNAAPGSDHR